MKAIWDTVHKYILEDCKPTLIIVSNNSQFKKIKDFINYDEIKIISFEKIDVNSLLINDIFNETLEVDDKFRVLRIGGKPNKGLYMISPNLTSKFGDIVAANSLATQSIHLASILSYS